MEKKFYIDPLFYITIITGIIISLLWRVLSEYSGAIEQHIHPLAKTGQWLDFLEMYVSYIIAFSIIEELIFRGILHRELLRFKFAQKRFLNLQIAGWIANILFACAHLTRSPLLSILVFFPGLVFAASFQRYRSVLPPVLLHLSFNLSYIGAFNLEYLWK